MTKLTPTDESTMGTVTAEVEPEGWRPIGEAPKMKTILLFAVTEWVRETAAPFNWRMETGFWHTGYENDEGSNTPWCWGGRQVQTYEVAPTHWQSLPAPPKDEPR